MPSETIQRELIKLEPSTVLELFEFDASSVGFSPDPILRFHAGTNKILTSVILDGNEYIPFPIEFEGFEYDGKGSLPRPVARIANINGIFSSYLAQYNNFLGCKLTRKRTFVRFIDGANWPSGQNPYGTPSTELISEDEFYIFQKRTETKELIEFELTTQMELNDVVIPNRSLIANTCTAKYYRDGLVCPFASAPVADKNDKTFLPNSYGLPTYGLSSLSGASPLEWQAQSYSSGIYVTRTSVGARSYGQKVYYVAVDNVGAAEVPGVSPKWVADSCSRTIRACKLRFTGSYLPYGGFPGISRYPFTN